MLLESDKNTLKKNIKREKLYNSAYKLFMVKGIKNTAIDDIVKGAGVAKGTFYLYFKDKYDIFNKIILQKSKNIFIQAIRETKEKHIHDFNDMCIFFVEYVIEYFKENKLIFKIINKNFSWSLYKIAITKLDEQDEIEEAMKFFENKMIERGMTKIEAEITLYLVIELVGSVSYNSIINNDPADIDVIKPTLYKKIISIIS